MVNTMQSQDGPVPTVCDEDLVVSLGAFENIYVEVTGLDGPLHVVRGGRGPVVYLLPGWPLSWWEYRKVLPMLSRMFTVVAIDLRGMGASPKPCSGYTKRVMARDIVGVMNALGHGCVHLVGSDIGAMVAYAVAANHRGRVASLTMVDAPHPYPGMATLPVIGANGADLQPWWFALQCAGGLPERLLHERYSVLQGWLFSRLSPKGAITQFDCEVFANAYATPAAVRAAAAWFRAFPKDMADFATYSPLTCPVLAMTSAWEDLLTRFLAVAAPDHAAVRAPTLGHWLALEDPEFFIHTLLGHLVAD